MDSNETVPPSNGFDEWANIDDRNGSDKSSNSGSQNSSSWFLVQDSSSVVDMGDTDELQSETIIDIESSDEQAGQPQSGMSENEFINRMRDHMAEEVGGYVWNAGKQTAKRAFDLYGNIDILRPYFHVEPFEVRERLIASMMPQMPKQTSPVTVNGELYGPLMLVLTLIAILLFSMKSSGHTVQEGTLIGTAFAVCFGYWLGASCIFKIVAHICNTHLTSLQILSLTGYALTGPCICLFITTFIQHDHLSFHLLWLIFGGLSALRMVSVFVSRTWQKKQGLIAGGIVAAFHMLFLLYLHFAFHEVTTALSFEQEQIIIGHKYTTQVIVGENMLPAGGMGRPRHRLARSLNASTPSMV